MIRINLLAGDRGRPKRGVEVDLAQKVTIGCTVILVATVVLIGWRFWSLRQDSAQLTQELAAADQELQRLAPVLERVLAFEAQGAQLTERVALIEQLRHGQSGPVRMLDEISRSLPDGLWLLELRQEDEEVFVVGRARTLTALSDFMANLEDSGQVPPPVEIVDSHLEDTRQGDVVRFELRATFVRPAS